MYLKKIAIEHAGPIPNLRLEMAFRDERPLPLVLVGPNGSGKSTLLSFIVNALVGFKQQAFEPAEVEHEKVYRVRSGRFIRRGACWYHAKLEFDAGLALDEWVLDRPRKAFDAQVSPLPEDQGWRQIPEDETDRFALTPQPLHPIQRALSRPMQKLFGENTVLFFPSDRFELPDWLNERSIAPELRFPEPAPFRGQTVRRIFSRALLKPTLEWIKAVVLDALLAEQGAPPSFHFVPGQGLVALPTVVQRSRDGRILDFVGKVLARILEADTDTVKFCFSHRNTAGIAAEFARSGRPDGVPNLLGLSAGQATLFCVFTNIIRDFDLAGGQFNDISDVRGIVILDEADMHLHIDLQYRVLPELMKLFPKVQFIVTAHSPLLVMGMQKAFSDDGFRVIDMPSGELIGTEEFSEFNDALDAFTRTRAFDQRLIDHVRNAAKPVVLVEGKSDATHICTAWTKLHPGQAMPWDVVACGAYSPKEGQGGAKMLRTLLHACCLHIERTALGLFDHDREGVEQFESLKGDGFEEATERTHLKHQNAPVHSLLLPVPPERETFVSGKAKSCFLAIEHYYPDAVLDRFGVADDPIVADSKVFGITTDSKKKSRLTDALPGLGKEDFANFELLFSRLNQALGVQSEQPASAHPLDEPIPWVAGTAVEGAQMPCDLHHSPIMVGLNDLGPAEPPRAPATTLPEGEVVGQSEPFNDNAQGE
jgi:hypothetical protein